MTYERPLNVEHFNKVIAHIRADLNRLWMPWYGVKKGSHTAKANRMKAFGDCGYACCFAGWSLLLSLPRQSWSGAFRYGLMLDISGSNEAIRLGLSGGEMSLFASVKGSRREQWAVVRERLRKIVAARIAAGEESARGIRI